MSWFDNPNKVTREHFQMAIEAAEECTPEPNREHHEVPRVGAVIVKDGNPIVVAHRNEVGAGDHAEYIAFNKTGIDAREFIGTDLITTLEPCSAGRHGKEKRPCVKWIIDHRIRKVWIGCLDRNPRITGQAVIKLREANPPIDVGWFPDDMISQILQQNHEFFKFISRKQPQINQDDANERLDQLRGYIKDEVEGFQTFMKNPLLEISDVSGRGLIREVTTPNAIPSGMKWHIDGQEMTLIAEDVLEFMTNAYAKSLSMDALNFADWNEVADTLLLAYEVGSQVFKSSRGHCRAKSRKHIKYLRRPPHLQKVPIPEDEHGPPMFEAVFQKDIFSVGIPGFAYETTTLLDTTALEPYIGKALVLVILGQHKQAIDILEPFVDSISTPDKTVGDIYYETACKFFQEKECDVLLPILRSVEFGFDDAVLLVSLTRRVLRGLDCQWHTEPLASALAQLAEYIRNFGNEELAEACLSLAKEPK